MSVASVPGHVLNSLIPNLFKEELIQKRYESSIIAQITNTRADSTGIKNMGDKVTFQRLADTTVRPNIKGQDMIMEFLSHTEVELNVDRSNYFYFGNDRIDLKQYLISDVMDKQQADANKQVEKYIATEFFADVYADASANNKGATAGVKSESYDLGATGAPIAVSKTTIVDQIAELAGVADEQNWPIGDMFLVLPSVFKVMIQTSELRDAAGTGKGSTLFNSFMGELFDFQLYSTKFYTTITETAGKTYPILFGHKDAICYVEQMTSMDYFEKLERTNAQAMRGVSVYDWKVIDPTMLGVWYAYKGA